MGRRLNSMFGRAETSTPSGSRTSIEKLKAEIGRELLDELDLQAARSMPVQDLRQECSNRADYLLKQRGYPLTKKEKETLLGDIMNDIFGLGPLESFMQQPDVSDILVNGYDHIYIERNGQIERTDVHFRDNNQVLQIIQRIATKVGRRIDESIPMLDARLMDGSRVNAIIPPLALDGPALSIRRFGTIKMDINKLKELGSLTEEMALFLMECVRCQINIVISGGTGAGKTTLLNILSGWIPQDERVVTIEDAAELQLQREHVVRLETRPPNVEAKGEITQRDLLRNSLRMRPDHIIIGEVRGAETLDMLQAMNTGHEGSLTTVHANSTRDALSRIENMISISGVNCSPAVIRTQISSALDLMVHMDRLTGGGRKIMEIAEITGLEGNVVTMHDIFLYKQTGVDGYGQAEGHFEACGTCPALLDRLEAEGAQIPEGLFCQRMLG
ncbi:MAG: CpaF family protein [Planctomycetota bacterium]